MRNPDSRAGLGITFVVLLALPLLGTGGLLQQASARQSNPAETPAAMLCDVSPRSTAEILALLAPPSGEIAPVVLAPPLPLGKPADPEPVGEIAAAVQELEACLNSGDLLRVYALLSDDWFRNLNQTEELRAELSALAATPPAPRTEGYREMFVGPWHVMTLEDERVLAAVVWFGSEDDLRLDSRFTQILIFVEHDGRWLIDEVIGRVFVPECGQSVRAAAVVGPPPGAALDGPPMSCGEIASHKDKEPSKARFKERQDRAAGATVVIPAALRQTIVSGTSVAK